MARNMRLQNLSAAIFLPLTLTFLLLLVIPGYSFESSNILGPATHDPPERLNNLTEECLQINAPMLFISLFAFTELGPHPEVLNTDHMYRVHLKAFTSHSDTLEILERPSLRSVVPTAVYNQGKNRGFVANLTYEQVCEIYKLPTVNTLSLCFLQTCGPDKKHYPAPSLNSTFPNAPDITGLSPDCAKIVWYNLAGSQRPAGAVAGTYYVTLKPFVTKEQAEKLLHSSQATGTNFTDLANKQWEIEMGLNFYTGRWNFTQLCYLEHQPEISQAGLSNELAGMYGAQLPS